jgi:hypothetical protein
MIKSPLEKKGGNQILDPKSITFGELIESLRLIDVQPGMVYSPGTTKEGRITG